MTDEEITDVIGERYGSLVIENYMYSGHRYSEWFSCRCDCGNHITVTYNKLVKGLKKSCGCRIRRFHNPNDHIGEVYGQWTIVDYIRMEEQTYIRYNPEPLQSIIRRHIYLARCTCGREWKGTIGAIKHKAQYKKCIHDNPKSR